MPLEQDKFWKEVSQIRSAERIRDLAEVFTGQAQITQMLDLVEPSASNISSRFFEPSCGNGNFLVGILERKLSRISASFRDQLDYEYQCIVALTSIYGIDIDSKNVKEARLRMKEQVIDRYSLSLNTRTRTANFDAVVDLILKTNVLRGDMLREVGKIRLTEYTFPKPHWISRRTYRLVDLLSYDAESLWADSAPVVAEYPLAYFLELQNNA